MRIATLLLFLLWMPAIVRANESVSKNEEEIIGKIVNIALKEMETRYSTAGVLVRRDAHAKGHGCVKANFEIDRDSPMRLRVGAFANPEASYPAWIRFSNGAFEAGSDGGMDGRGMALKIMGSSSSGEPINLDLLMINFPVFFSSNAADYLDFAEAGALTGRTEGLRRYFLPSFNPFSWRIRQAMIAYRIASQKIESPLTTQYFSMVPFALGDGQAVKYSAKPCSAAPRSEFSSVDKDANFLRRALTRHLSQTSACFELLVQERRGDMSVEDATANWDDALAPFERLGRLTIPQQHVEHPERDAFCENVSFTPWQAPMENRPLGSMNRVRRAVYEAISNFRHARNRAAPVDPRHYWRDLP